MKEGGSEPEVHRGIEIYDARRCRICGRRFPPFGFGPPLCKPEQTLWACFEHRDEVERMVRGPENTPLREREPRLL